MRWIGSLWGTLVGLGVIVVAARLLGLDDLIRDSIAAGRLLDWLMGAFCFVWLLVLLKAPWDLYFEAHRVAWEQERSREKGIPLAPGRERYVRTVRQRLGVFAVGAHVLSAVLAAGVARFTGGAVGYWFAAFFLVSTLFRPTAAGYVYLRHKLRDVGEESRYPREDVETVVARLGAQEAEAMRLSAELEELRRSAQAEAEARESETRELRQRQMALGREFEATVSRLTDNQEVIRGIQAFVRLIGQAATGDAG
jgi:hypothetical protein